MLTQRAVLSMPAALAVASSNSQSIRLVEAFAAPYRVTGKQAGYRHFNLKVSPDPKFDLELCKYVRAQAPEGVQSYGQSGRAN